MRFGSAITDQPLGNAVCENNLEQIDDNFSPAKQSENDKSVRNPYELLKTGAALFKLAVLKGIVQTEYS